MKKRVLLLLILAVVFTGKMSAQKGMNGIGISVPMGHLSERDHNGKSFAGGWYAGVGVKYYYNLTNHFRIEPSMEFSWASPSYSFKGMLNLNLFVYPPSRVRPYLIVGAGWIIESLEYSTFTKEYKGEDSQYSFGLNYGLGFDCRLSHTWSMQLEAAYARLTDAWVNNSNAFIARWGLTYNF